MFFNSVKDVFVWKNNRGFSLPEAVMALSILSIAVAALAPSAISIYEERRAIKERLMSQTLLANELQQVLLGSGLLPGGRKNVKKMGVIYEIERLAVKGRHAKVCVTFRATNGRKYKECGVVGRWVDSQDTPS